MGFMFIDVDSAISNRVEAQDPRKTVPKDPVEAALYDIRETIQILFVMAFKKVCAAGLRALDKLMAYDT